METRCGAAVKAEDHRFLVEPACGATLAMAYEPELLKQHVGPLTPESVVVLEVCGGQAVTPDLLEIWRQTVGGSQ